MKPKILILLVALMSALMLFSSCGEQEIAVSDVKDTDAYKELQADNEELERKYEKIKSKFNALNVSEDAVSHSEIMNGISKSTFTKLICKGGEDPNANTTITDEDLLKRLKVRLTKSIIDNKTKLSSLPDKESYTYTIVKDDNSIIALIVYEGDRVVFNDKLDTVYYCDGVSFIGEAFYGDGSFVDELNVSIPQAMYNSEICYLDDVLMSADARESVAYKLNRAIGKKVDVDDSMDSSEPYHSLIIYYYGKAYELKFYDKYIEFKNMDKPEDNTKYAYKSLNYKRIFE